VCISLYVPPSKVFRLGWAADSFFEVGVSIAVSFPLILVAFNLNRITKIASTEIARRRGKRPGAAGAPRKAADGDDSGSDSDNDSVQQRMSSDTQPKTAGSSENLAAGGGDGDYAYLFGRFSLHTRIPYLRRLWKYHVYKLNLLEDVDTGLDDFVWDYPLRRFRKNLMAPAEKVLLALGLRQLWESYHKHETTYRQREYEEYNQEIKELVELREMQERDALRRSLDLSSVAKQEKMNGEENGADEDVPGTDTRDFGTQSLGQEHDKRPGFVRVLSRRRQRTGSPPAADEA